MENVEFVIDVPMATPNSTIINAYNELGLQIGYLYAPQSRIITDLWVHPDYRRQGIATALYERVKQQPQPIYHDAVHHQTQDYIAWQESVGGEIASDELAFESSCRVCTGEEDLWGEW